MIYRFDFLESGIAMVFFAWNSTSHSMAQSEIVRRSAFIILAA